MENCTRRIVLPQIVHDVTTVHLTENAPGRVVLRPVHAGPRCAVVLIALQGGHVCVLERNFKVAPRENAHREVIAESWTLARPAHN